MCHKTVAQWNADELLSGCRLSFANLPIPRPSNKHNNNKSPTSYFSFMNSWRGCFSCGEEDGVAPGNIPASRNHFFPVNYLNGLKSNEFNYKNNRWLKWNWNKFNATQTSRISTICILILKLAYEQLGTVLNIQKLRN